LENQDEKMKEKVPEERQGKADNKSGEAEKRQVVKFRDLMANNNIWHHDEARDYPNPSPPL